MTPARIIVADSVTLLGPDARGCVAVNASHGGRIAAAMATNAGVRAAIFNDAGVGLDEAGVAGLAFLEDLGVAAAAIDHDSARIGDGADMWARGVISYCNDPAWDLGVRPGQSCTEAADRLALGPHRTMEPSEAIETRILAIPGPVPVWLLDSASMVQPSDRGAIVVTGSHGGLLGGQDKAAVKAEVLAAIFNDAGGGADDAGFGRLPALQRRGIVGATVSSDTARIGDARSTFEDGRISACNALAAKAGVVVGMRAEDAVHCLAAAAASLEQP